MDWMAFGILLGGYLFCFIVGSFTVRRCIAYVDPNFKKGYDKPVIDTGMIIGLCESFLTITFILTEAITGLAIIFAAKSIVRSKKMEERPEYYLLGTIVNFTFSVFVGVVLKLILDRFYQI